MKPVKSILILNRISEPLYVDEAPIFTETKNETLDTGNIILSNLTSKIDNLSSYDVVDLLDEDGEHIKYMCIDTYTETITCVNPRIYKYEISLFSETKLLEGIVLPNLKITKVWNTRRNVYFYINRYLEEYSPWVRVKGTGLWFLNYKWDWTYDDNNDGTPDLEERFSMECPEMQWNTPTLREVLNDLMMVDDCIPVIRDGRLEYMDLTETGRDVSNNEYINYVSRSKSSEDYVSELQVKLENVTNKEDINNVVTMIEYHTFNTNDEEVVLTNKNLFLKTQYPIYKIKKLEMVFYGYGNTLNDGAVGGWLVQDLCEISGLVTEYQEWITKNILYNQTAPNSLSDFPNSQNWSIFYKRGSREIGNFSSKTRFIWVTNYLIDELQKAIVKRQFPETVGGWQGGEYYQCFFKVEYETLEGCMFRASKGDYPEHDRVVMDNQTNSYVDSYSQGFLEYQKANRLGNEQLHINARIPLNERLIEIGDIFDDCVIYQCQYQFFRDHTEINALATKNYILREYFTGVKSKIRSWAIVSGSEALIRHDLEKYYCEFSWLPHKDRLPYEYSLIDYEVDISEYLLKPLLSYEAKPLRYCYVRSRAGARYYPDDNIDNKYYSIDLVSRIVGNSLVFTFKFLDNYWVGQSFDTDYVNVSNMDNYGKLTKNALVGGGIPVQQNRYTDSNGENHYLEVMFGDGIKIIPASLNIDDPQIPETDNPWTLDQLKYFEFYNYKKPIVIQSSIVSSTFDYRKIGITSYHRKDSQEITNLSTQFEFSSDTLDICFTKEWLKRQQSISITDNDVSNYKILMFSKSLYNFRRPDVFPSNVASVEYFVSTNVTNVDGSNLNSAITIIILHQYNTEALAIVAANRWLERYCFYLNDGDMLTPNILMAFKDMPTANISYPQDGDGKYNIAFTFYLNILRTRNKNIYDEENHYLIVGHI